MTPAQNPRVAIIDYRLGNMFSVLNACRAVGLNAQITSSPEELLSADAAILPGVGAFGDAMGNLRSLHLDDAIRTFVSTGKHFMGICLGLQLLFRESEEFGASKGLSLIDGLVKRFPNVDRQGNLVKVPQIGWNTIHRPADSSGNRWVDTPLEGLQDSRFMYFVHSYFVQPEGREVVLTETEYMDVLYCSAVQVDNVYASQFHPEKSGVEGIHIYRQWSSIINREGSGLR